MRATDWNGNPPSSPEEARERLLQAGFRCAEKYSLAKINIKRVAEEIGVTRQTVYRYFGSTEELITAMSFAVGGEVLNGMTRKIERFTSYEDKIIESLVYLTIAIPNDPFLGQYFLSEDPKSNNTHMLFEPLALDYTYEALKDMIGDGGKNPLDEKNLRIISEHCIRMLFSLINTSTKTIKSTRALRKYLDVCLRPVLKSL